MRSIWLRSRNPPYIKHWLAVFPDLKVIRLEDYKENKSVVMNELYNYIGLEPMKITNKDTKVINKTPNK